MIVYLVGMPGSGKSTVGPELARRLDMPFLELDAEIERAAGKGVTEIFEEDGEPRFRELEAAALKDAAALDPSVISCGGGVVLEPSRPRGERVPPRMGPTPVLRLARRRSEEAEEADCRRSAPAA